MTAAKYSAEQWIVIPPKMIQSQKFRNIPLGNVIYEHSDGIIPWRMDSPTEENEQLR